jgi:hypothetical protein
MVEMDSVIGVEDAVEEFLAKPDAIEKKSCCG